ncbi:hypothetical protein EN829_031545 [Mesorhizobium sp. M00.F.Ca.ET.186.01.1.1]|nr:MAG: hypothetical protein EOS47_12130 [Mesorhizobium sp.]TGQ63426.1 hypothetical protein EN848_31470 [bacterium M00.F.Ca.ET.205.01.1.1]TGU46611.1 hypothetical protein EN795_31865 [bacterium M00.F.Ca.ET.152.01.1.1]TGV31699.1 hypothetical protein EN829_031545 [Mesorhizobium sp. M00.F.Ca.ET.186.01.1.1]TGZ38882.1 hypothetical protein EN805_31460 [bacterium M00.F.Ca.ET.162.01.1.1]
MSSYIKVCLDRLQSAINILRVGKAAQRLGLYPIILSTYPALYDYLASAEIEAIRVDTDDVALIRGCSPLRATHDLAGTAIYDDPVRPTTTLPRPPKQVSRRRQIAALSMPELGHFSNAVGGGMQIDLLAKSLVRDFVDGATAGGVLDRNASLGHLFEAAQSYTTGGTTGTQKRVTDLSNWRALDVAALRIWSWGCVPSRCQTRGPNRSGRS